MANGTSNSLLSHRKPNSQTSAAPPEPVRNESSETELEELSLPT